ncbi:hypothetical protein [Polynucleobacter necessarius]|uniref:hypothetical protein n=1 Tax=Polynucleobacter necessarius TaxID=576610 RepID=UPI001E50C674|nr:hypothetical protein [Polynucleobacter necessarius]
MTTIFMTFLRTAVALGSVLLVLAGCQSTGKDGKPLTQAEIMQKREATIQMAKTGLDALIKQAPKVKKEIDKAAGTQSLIQPM